MNSLTKIKVDEMLALKKRCEENGIDYDTFIAGCRVIYKQKQLSEELLSKAKRALTNIIEYGAERAKLKNTTIADITVTDVNFLAHGFQYCMSKEEGVDPAIQRYASYCNIHFDMFDPKDMQDLAKKVAKKMKLSVKEDDPKYLDEVIRVMPEYLSGETPSVSQKGFVADFVKKVSAIVTDRPSLARANALCLPDARGFYVADDESFALEFYARQQETPSIEGRGEGVILVRQLGHYLICDETGMVLHDSLDAHQFAELQYGSTAGWIAERKELIKSPEYLSIGIPSTVVDGIHTVTDSEGLIVLATPNPQEANAFQCLYNNGGVDDEYVRKHLYADYGMNDTNYESVTNAILAEVKDKYDLSKFVSNSYQALLAITPLLAAGIDKF